MKTKKLKRLRKKWKKKKVERMREGLYLSPPGRRRSADVEERRDENLVHFFCFFLGLTVSPLAYIIITLLRYALLLYVSWASTQSAGVLLCFYLVQTAQPKCENLTFYSVVNNITVHKYVCHVQHCAHATDVASDVAKITFFKTDSTRREETRFSFYTMMYILSMIGCRSAILTMYVLMCVYNLCIKIYNMYEYIRRFIEFHHISRCT